MDLERMARSRIVMNTLQLHRNTTRNVERQISQISCTIVEMDGGTAPKGSSRFTCVIYGVVAQLGERLPCKQEVASSRLVFSTNNRGVIQLVECVVWDHDAAGSSPVAPTISKKFDFSYKL